MQKDVDAYRTISEVAEALDIPPHVLRFWETKFTQIKPLKRGGGRRYYRRTDVELLRAIRRLLYEDAYTIRGVQRLLKTRGPSAVAAIAPGEAPPPETEDAGLPVADGPCTDAIQALVTELATEVATCRALLAEAFGPQPDRGCGT